MGIENRSWRVVLCYCSKVALCYYGVPLERYKDRRLRGWIGLIEQGANDKVICTKYHHEPSGAYGQPGYATFISDHFFEHPKYIAIKKRCQENQDDIHIG